MQGVIQSAIAWLCSSNLRRETLLAPQGLAVPQQRGWCHRGQATLGGAAVGEAKPVRLNCGKSSRYRPLHASKSCLVDLTALAYSFQARRPPTRMPPPLLLLQQLQCRDSGFGLILKIDLQGNPPKAQNRQIR
jgi:hypothetical protein